MPLPPGIFAGCGTGSVAVGVYVGGEGADDPLARPFHARPQAGKTKPQAGKSGKNNRKQGTDGKPVACSDVMSPGTLHI